MSAGWNSPPDKAEMASARVTPAVTAATRDYIPQPRRNIMGKIALEEQVVLDRGGPPRPPAHT
jgi:hypothetical protein